MNVEKLKQLKKDAGYTNKMIADESGVPLGTVQKIFSGETKAPRFKTLKAIEEILITASGYEAELQLAAAKLQAGSAQADFMPDRSKTAAADRLSYDVQNSGTDDKVLESSDRQSKAHSSDIAAVAGSGSEGSAVGGSGTENTADEIPGSDDMAGTVPGSADVAVGGSGSDVIADDVSETDIALNKNKDMLRVLMAGDIIFEIKDSLRESGEVAYLTGPGIKVEMPAGGEGTSGDAAIKNEEDTLVCFPDVAMIRDKDAVRADGIYGAPDLIVEIMDSETRSNQLGSRPDAYRNAGVREYWMIDIDAKNIMAYDFEEQALPSMYGFSGKIPVRTAGDDCKVNFAQLYGYVGFLFR